MDFTLIAYGMSMYLGVLALTTIAYLGTWEIHAQALPPFLVDQGYTTEIFVNQMIDEIGQIRRETASQSQTDFLISGQATPVAEVASFFGVAGLIRAGQSVIGVAPPTIEIEITERDGIIYWRLRGPHALGSQVVETGEARLENAEGLLKTVAHQAISMLSPFEAAAYDLILDSRVGTYSETISMTSGLLRECSALPAAICTAQNLKTGHMIRGLAYLNSGNFQAAFDDLQIVSEEGSKDALGTAFLGDVVLALGDDAGALERYAAARALDESVAERFVGFAHGLAEAGNHPLALKRFETAQALGANTAEFLASWADSLVALGELEPALSKYLQAENVDTETELFAERVEEIRKMIADVDTSKTTPPIAAPAAVVPSQ